METNKQWKRVPFTIELAKDIQSGKVEGRIVTSEDLLVRIVDFNFKDKTDSIVYIGTYANGEQEFIQTCDNEGKSFGADVLFIELPEETPKQKGELTLGKCKEGDEVWIYSNYEYGPEYVKVKVGKYSLDTSSGHRRNVIFDNGFTCQELTSQICWYENPDEQKTKTKEFKPFDKVLVRNHADENWKPDMFWCKTIRYKEDAYKTMDGDIYKQCIPYEGNEHLVGITNNPE